MRLGYACINLSLPTRLRTVRLRNATRGRVLELARLNLEETARAGAWNASHGIGMLRLTSDMVPFGSHKEVSAASGWREALGDDLAATGRSLQEADQRVGTHPGQYSVLNSPRPEVVEAAREDLSAHADMLDLMGVDGTIILHVGGAYGDRDAARGRFVDEARALPERIRRRLVLENDDVTWNAAETLEVAREARLPVVFDVFHDRRLPSEGLPMREGLRRALATWRGARVPKIHYSDAAGPEARRGTHGDRVDPVGFREFLDATRGLPDFDVMIEAKHKDHAVLPLLPLLGPRATRLRGASLFPAPSAPAPVA